MTDNTGRFISHSQPFTGRYIYTPSLIIRGWMNQYDNNMYVHINKTRELCDDKKLLKVNKKIQATNFYENITQRPYHLKEQVIIKIRDLWERF